jgi:hypothetical protein
MIKKTIRKILPPWLRAINRNCGGFNPDATLFAGRLLSPDLTDDQWLKMVNALIFGNGVRKSTRFNRNAPVLERLIADGTLRWDKPGIKVLDMGASVGIDAIGNLAVLSKHFKVSRYTLGDLYTEVQYDTFTQRIYDHDGNLIQVLLPNGFATLNFEFKYRIEPLFHWQNRRKTGKLKKQLAGVKPNPETTIPIPLIYPPVKENPVFNLKKVSVFEPMAEKYDLIICMNLLQPRYFPQDMIDLGNQNLLNSLSPGGVLLTGVTEKPSLGRQESGIVSE